MQAASCKIGTDTAVVVAPQLREHGQEVLRVPDAPHLADADGHSHALTIAIAEKAIDHLRQTR